MSGRRWKRLHRSVYIALGVVLLHALLTGADFGLKRAPDVRGEPDAGAGITFLCVSAAWVVLFIFEANGSRLAVIADENGLVLGCVNPCISHPHSNSPRL